MKKGRLEAFSDGVFAIIITIMVLELRVPVGGHLKDLTPVVPVLLSYILSFVYVGIYWNNHHHMLYAVNRINGAVLWANLHLLFWLSLIPFVTGWMGENHFTRWPVILYGVVLIMNAIAYTILCWLLHRACSLPILAGDRPVRRRIYYLVHPRPADRKIPVISGIGGGRTIRLGKTGQPL
jgi:uncharacterized membrane protein